MKRDEQHKIVLSLREHVNAMSEKDKDLFAVLLKRDRDDEDLDTFALQQLKRLHEHYARKRPKNELEAQWKRLTSH